MARLPRLTLAGYPHLVLQRGNNRQPIFLGDEDRERFLELLRSYARQYRVAIHAYVLMPNHVHLLATPETSDGVPPMMQALGRHYVRYFNRRHARSGTLWEGRFRSALIEPDPYLLAAMAYIERNPVRAGLVAAPTDYRWSSHAHHVGQRSDPLVRPHALYWALGDTPFARERAYAQWASEALGAELHAQLARSAHSGWALGSAKFVAALGQATARRVSPGRPGRPMKRADSTPDS